MKLQIEAQNLRVRIGEDELAQLLTGQSIEARTQFADAFAMHYVLELTSADAAAVTGSPALWRIAIPEAQVRRHAALLPFRDGLAFVLPGAHGEGSLQLLFDVDVRDSTRRRYPRD